MKRTQLLAILFAVLVLAGALLRIYAYETGCIMLFSGTLYLCLYYLIKTLIDFKNGVNNKFTTFFQLIIALMSIVIYTKYTFQNFGNYVGLFVVPVFIIYAIIFWIKTNKKTIDLTLVSVIYFILTIPMFFVFYYQSSTDNFYTYRYPLQYVKKHNIDETINYHYIFGPEVIMSEKVTQLNKQASKLEKEGKYQDAIAVYCQAISIEPDNDYLYFRLSAIYRLAQQYNFAISALDSAIIIDATRTEYFINRAKIYSDLKEKDLALKDLEKSLQLDSTNAVAYISLAIIYFDLYNDMEKASEAMDKVALYDRQLAKEYRNLKRQINYRQKLK